MFEAMAQGSGGLLIGLVLLFLVIAGLVAALTIFWIMMIVDCVQRKKLTDSERVAWILVLVFLGFVGAIIYYFAVKR